MTKIHGIGSFLIQHLRRDKRAAMPSRGYHNLGDAEHGLATSVTLVVNRNQPTVTIAVLAQTIFFLCMSYSSLAVWHWLERLNTHTARDTRQAKGAVLRHGRPHHTAAEDGVMPACSMSALTNPKLVDPMRTS